jgi:triacylglycerol lipase
VTSLTAAHAAGALNTLARRLVVLAMALLTTFVVVALPLPALAAERNPVLLIHGIDDTRAVMEPLGRYLEERGWRRFAFDMVPSNGQIGFEALARQIQAQVAAVRAQTGAAKVDIVGFSLGGMVARVYLQELGGAAEVERLVTISSPHQGSWMAYFRWNALGAELRPGSTIYQRLNGDLSALSGVRMTSIWTPFDLMILPAWSSLLPGARDVRIPVAIHPWMLRDARCHAAVEAALRDDSPSP